MDLAAYLKLHEISQADFARRIACDRSNFHRLVKGDARPTLAQAVAIERETDGSITASSWVEQARAA